MISLTGRSFVSLLFLEVIIHRLRRRRRLDKNHLRNLCNLRIDHLLIRLVLPPPLIVRLIFRATISA